MPIARAGVTALRATRWPDINLLMTVAAVGAVAIGAWTEAAFVVVLFSVGQALERRAVERARRELEGLVSLTPVTARLVRQHGESAEEIEVAVADLQIGDHVVVRPGERIAADGTVVDGAFRGRPSADHGRVEPGRQGARRHRLRRHAEPSGTARDRGVARPGRHHTRSNCAARSRRSRAASSVRALDRPLRPRVHADRDRGRCDRRCAAPDAGSDEHVAGDLQRAGLADPCVSRARS